MCLCSRSHLPGPPVADPGFGLDLASRPPALTLSLDLTSRLSSSNITYQFFGIEIVTLNSVSTTMKGQHMD
ncbi:hypothetical protein GDO81_008014 [Engystomops pustulosus]|uniref:Uncharacterized protein n=1 Tax=Engystomops pustulosus TaxID=76066 RepID=A0AAV7CBE5_ENGPU|nr:hypothetical protein GDO81_008014 [Engystomops pustulosus]